MPSFKVNNWDLDVIKKKLSVSIKAHNASNTLFYRKKMTNKDVAEGGFKLIDDINDLYATLTEGSNPCQENTKLNFTDDGHLKITQKVVQADREKVFNNDIALEKREPPAAVSQKDIKGLLDRVAELENEVKGLKTSNGKTNEESQAKIAELENQMKGLQTTHENDLTEVKKINEEQTNSIKSLQEENANLKKSFEEAEKRGLTNSFSFIPNPNFDVSNNGKRALSKGDSAQYIISSVSLTKGINYSFRIIGDYFIMIGLTPETNPNVDLAYAKSGAFSFACDGYIRSAEGNTSIQGFKDGDIVNLYLTDDSKVHYNINGQWIYTYQLQSSTTKYLLFLYSHNKVSIGAELV